MYEKNMYVWKEHVCMKGTYTYERNIYVWMEYICMKGTYMYERNIYVWKEHICMKGTYMHETSSLISSFISFWIWSFFFPSLSWKRWRNIDGKKPSPPGGCPIYYVPSSRTVCKRTPLEGFVPGSSRGVLLNTVLDKGT